MAAYSAYGPSGTGGASHSTVDVGQPATVVGCKPKIYEIGMGCSGTPADQQATHQVQHATARGTATSFTPVPLDGDDRAAVATVGITHSAEPTYTANKGLVVLPVHQRSFYRWIARQNGELKVKSSASNSIGHYVAAITSGTPIFNSYFHWEE